MIGIFLLIVVVGIVVGLDYRNYKNGSRSHFFGTLDSYTRKQTLHLYDLDLKVTAVKVTPYDVTDFVAKTQTCINKAIGQDSFGFNLNKDLCETNFKPESGSASEFAQNYKKIEVDFSYNNISNQPINFDTRNYDLISNTQKYNYFRECNYQWSETLIKGSPQTSCVREDVSKEYSGPFNLEIKLYGKTKQIVIEQ